VSVWAEVDLEACNGFGNCTVAAPRVFRIDPDTHLSVAGSMTADDADDVEEAVADCPVQAIRLHRG
jgi:ferredoxin